MTRDTLYASPRGDLVDFQFDEEVARVFPDMIRRSVPGYDNIVTMTGLIAGHYARSGTRIYDMGSSLGASMASMLRNINVPDIEPICIDTSSDMLEQCYQNLTGLYPGRDVCCTQADLLEYEPAGASVIVMNFVLQFIDPLQRQQVISRLASGLLSGGVLVLSEKVLGDDPFENALHREFKKANGYSDLEISQKRSALERVMVLDTKEQHLERLSSVGLVRGQQWFQSLNFRSFVAFKP